VYKKGTYFGRLALRIKQSIFATGTVVAAIECLALAPAPAAGKELPFMNLGLGYKVGTILDQLGIHAKDEFQSHLQLLWRVVCPLKSENGLADKSLERRNIRENGLPDGEDHAVLG
jgi:hypothetical protein